MAGSVTYLAPGAGRFFQVLGGDIVYIKAGTDQTGGSYTVFETTVPPQGGPPRHVHHRETETFYVLDGEFEFRVGDTTQRATTGAFLIAPPGLAHQFKNVGATPGKLLIYIHPAGFEKFIEEFSQLPIDQSPDFAKMAEIAARHGLEFLP